MIKGGRVIDPAAKMDAPMDVLLRDGRVVEHAAPNKIRSGADEAFDARAMVIPYLIFVRGLPGYRYELDETFASKAVELRALADIAAKTPGAAASSPQTRTGS